MAIYRYLQIHIKVKDPNREIHKIHLICNQIIIDVSKVTEETVTKPKINMYTKAV
jgi:hypothetical protein